MSTTSKKDETVIDQETESQEPQKRELPPAAQRALAEAEERRRMRADAAGDKAKEINGREGPEPTRYGDWEKGGLAVDF
mgnify:CR=1 FL=1